MLGFLTSSRITGSDKKTARRLPTLSSRNEGVFKAPLEDSAEWKRGTLKEQGA